MVSRKGHNRHLDYGRHPIRDRPPGFLSVTLMASHKSDRLTVADLVIGLVGTLELEAIRLLRIARELHAVESSPYTTRQLAYADALTAAYRTLRGRIPASWRHTFTELP